MSDHALLPPDGPELAGWLSARVASLDLVDTVRALSRDRKASSLPQPPIETVLGEWAAGLLSGGFRAVPDQVLRQLRSALVEHPNLLFDIQELIFLHGGPVWNEQLTMSATSTASDQVVERVMERISGKPSRWAAWTPTAASAPPVRPSPPTRKPLKAGTLAATCLCLICGITAAASAVALVRQQGEVARLTEALATESRQLESLHAALDSARGERDQAQRNQREAESTATGRQHELLQVRQELATANAVRRAAERVASDLRTRLQDTASRADNEHQADLDAIKILKRRLAQLLVTLAR